MTDLWWWLAGGGVWVLAAFGVGLLVGRVTRVRDRQRPDDEQAS